MARSDLVPQTFEWKRRGGGGEFMYVWSRSHDHNGHQAQIRLKTLKIFTLITPGPIAVKLGM